MPSLREWTEIASMPGASGAVRSARKVSQQAPSRQLVENSPGIPRSPRRATQRTVRSTGEDTAKPSRTGDPSITRPQTDSGSRTARARARAPPRLCPMSTTGRSQSLANSCRSISRRVTIRSAQPTFARMPLMATRCPRRRNHALSTLSDASPAMNPGISSTGAASSRGRDARSSPSASSRASSRP